MYIIFWSCIIFELRFFVHCGVVEQFRAAFSSSIFCSRFIFYLWKRFKHKIFKMIKYLDSWNISLQFTQGKKTLSEIILGHNFVIVTTFLGLWVVWFHHWVGETAALIRLTRSDHSTAITCTTWYTSLLKEILFLQLPMLLSPITPWFRHLIGKLLITLTQVSFTVTIVGSLGIHCVGLK